MEAFAFLSIFIVIAIVVRLLAGGLDNERVREYVRSQGGVLLEKDWAPFGKGWFGEKNARIYEVRYRDQQGNIHAATVKTSMFSGVYFTQDRIVSHASPRADSSAPNSLVAENERLRKRLSELEGGGN